jgi:hypothetical protein
MMTEEENITSKLLKFITETGGRDCDESFLYCHSPEDRKIPLCCRTDIIRQVRGIWTLRKKSFRSSTNRTDFRHPICVGIPGVGKTRMLEEWNQIFSEVGISETERIGLLVLYFNGHSICSVDADLPIAKTFAWRMLHRHFFEGSLLFTEFMNQLESSTVYKDVSILQSILAILKSRNLNPSVGAPLSFSWVLMSIKQLPEVMPMGRIN